VGNPKTQPVANNASPAALVKTFAATTVVLVAALVVLLLATGGGQSFTTETLRRHQISQQPELIPDFDVTLENGQRSTLKAVLAPGGKVWLVDFVYIRCQTLCLSLGSVYQQLQAQIEVRGLQGKVGLLSISFDPANDSPAALADYAKRMGVNPQVWRIATLTHWQDRRRLLDAFGIMVLPAPLGEFEHNAALHVVTSGAMLTRIMDYADAKAALDIAVASGNPSAAAL
jgi:protein SCO1/2